MAIHIDQRYLPLIYVSHAGATSDDEFDAHLDALHGSMVARNAGPRLLILDATRSVPTPATQRRKQAEWMKTHASLIRELTVGTAFVIPSGLIRGVLTAILWIQPLPCPHEVCATVDEAMAWGELKLRDRGLTLPLGARRDYLSRPRIAAQ